MIRSFKDRRAERLFRGDRIREFASFADQAEKRLRLLDAADTLMSLRMLPSNRLEALGGDRKGQFSIRINRQWRVRRTTSRLSIIIDGDSYGPAADPSR